MRLPFNAFNQHALDLGQKVQLPPQYAHPEFKGAVFELPRADQVASPHVVVKRRRLVQAPSSAEAEAANDSDRPSCAQEPSPAAAQPRVHRIVKAVEASPAKEPATEAGVAPTKGLRATKREVRQPRLGRIERLVDKRTAAAEQPPAAMASDRWDFMAPRRRAQAELEALWTDVRALQESLEAKLHEAPAPAGAATSFLGGSDPTSPRRTAPQVRATSGRSQR